jgi:hypothetical protein
MRQVPPAPPQRFQLPWGFNVENGAKKWSENSPRPESPWVFKPLMWLAPDSCHISRHVVILSAGQKFIASPPALSECCRQPVCDSATSLKSQWSLHTYFVEGTLYQLPINLRSYIPRTTGNWLFASAKWGNSNFKRESGKEMGLSYKPGPSRLFGQTFLGLNVRGSKLPPCVHRASHLYRQHKASNGLRTKCE